MIAVAALPFTMPAQAGINDPVNVIYRASGVLDLDTGFATAIFAPTSARRLKNSTSSYAVRLPPLRATRA